MKQLSLRLPAGFKPTKPVLFSLGLGLGLLIFLAFILPRIRQRLSPESAPTITLVHWGLRQPTSTFTQAIADFEALNAHIKINYLVQSEADYWSRLQTALASDRGPDLFRYHLTWAPQLLKQLAPMPASVYSTAEYEAIFYPANQAWLKTKRGYLGLPLEVDGLGLYYNTAILAAAGIQPPQTPNELRSTAKLLTLTVDNQIQRAGIALGTTKNVEHWSDFLAFSFLQNGADLAQPNTPEGQGALTYYTLFATEDQVWNDTLPPSTYAFATGKAAMMVAPSWRVPQVKQLNPDLPFAVAPLPQLPQRDQTWANYWVEGVSASISKDRRQAAWLWLQYLSQADTLRMLYTAASASQLVGMPFPRLDMADQLIEDQYVGAFIQQAPTAQTWYLNSSTAESDLNQQVISLYQTAVNEVLTGEPASEVLVDTEEGIQALLNPAKIKRR
ncbi:hypothetical protein A2W24_00285 [Microgenomates group bacterium RBG_16_45_19]|nr:MAG: hypothetical protein A2W24_00285 [Microgenomates group bacterium RBG_16_45_19]